MEGLEKPEVRVGVLPIVGAAPLYLALEQGLFEQVGLSVRLSEIQSGEFAVPSLVRGELDITFSNYVSLIGAYAEGEQTRIIAEGSRAAEDNFAVVTLPDSAFTHTEDLNQETIGVNAIDNIATLMTNSKLSAAGVRPDQVTYREFDFPHMAASLKRGDVDAAFLPEPFLSQAKIEYAARTMFAPASDATAGIPIDGYATMNGFVRDNPRTVRAFQKALREAQRQCADDSVLRGLLQRALKVEPDVAAVLSPSRYPITLHARSIQRVADLMRLFGAVQNPVEVKKMVVQS
ncbi:ABC transporter substrate-binding protein [Halosaccharopolyspora lacisalsi]|uniref:ABC transporter substrate-binding protein n=1 Tax=Halosaccharopolyspora lacisalsi TaxID=1000566 RepID=UPI002E2C7B75|nr:ABC transporter substrate-binding protein [Halosaccharopolyspora lacisalsi]